MQLQAAKKILSEKLDKTSATIRGKLQQLYQVAIK